MELVEKTLRNEKVLLILIIVFSIFFYFSRLGSVPSGLYVDEALSGYNAFSVLETGRDEYGKVWPIAFRFFGSYSPPIYVYLTTFVIKYFGLSVFSTRFISAFLGVICVYLFYLFLKNLQVIKSTYIILFCTLLFAISPWHLFYARTGYEIYLGAFIFILGAYLTWRGFKNKKYLSLGFAVLSLSTYGAHTERFLVPIFVLLLLVVFRKKLFSKDFLQTTTMSLFVMFLIQIPNLYLVTTPSFFGKGNMFYANVVITQADKISSLPRMISILLSFIREFSSQYLTYFSPRSLFFLPDPDPQRSIPELSVFYFWMIVPYLVGIWAFWANRKKDAIKYILLLVFTTPLPTTLVGDPFSTQRALPLFFPLSVVIAVGIERIFSNYQKPAWSVFMFLFLFSLLLLWRSYFVLLSGERAVVWNYGFDKLALEIKNRPGTHFVIDQVRMKPAYIELLFFLKYPPEKFHQEVDQLIKENYYFNISFNSNYSFGNIETRSIDWKSDIYKEQVIVGDEFSVSKEQIQEHFFEKIFEIRSPIDEIIFVGYKTNPNRKCSQDSDNVHCK